MVIQDDKRMNVQNHHISRLNIAFVGGAVPLPVSISMHVWAQGISFNWLGIQTTKPMGSNTVFVGTYGCFQK